MDGVCARALENCLSSVHALTMPLAFFFVLCLTCAHATHHQRGVSGLGAMCMQLANALARFAFRVRRYYLCCQGRQTYVIIAVVVDIATDLIGGRGNG